MSKIKIQTSMGEMKEASVIGPSNLGTLFGVNKYENDYDLWLRLTARKIRETNQFAQRGIEMEKYIAMEYAERNMSKSTKLVTGVPFKKHPKIACFGCYTDGDIYEVIEEPDGKIIEKYLHSCNIKTISSDFGAENFDDPIEWVMKSKPDWFYQAQGEMSIDGSSYHDIIVWPSPVVEYDEFLKKLVANGSFDDRSFRDKFFDSFPILAVITIPRNDEVIGEIERKVVKFWNDNIVADIPPSVSDQEMEPTKTVSEGKITLTDPELVKAIVWVKKTRASLEQVEEEVWAKLNNVDAHEIMAGDVKVFKNPSTPRKYLNSNLMLAELPKMAIRKALSIGIGLGAIVGDTMYKILETILTNTIKPHVDGIIASLPVPDIELIGKELTDNIVKDFNSNIRRTLVEYNENMLIEASRGLDYSECYQTTKPTSPYNYRFGK